MTPQQITTDLADGTVEQRDGRTVLRYDRRLRHPVPTWDRDHRPRRRELQKACAA